MDDLISRRAALNAMDTWDKFGCDPDGKLVRYDDDNHYVPYVHYDDMVHVIKHLPSAVKHGRWTLECGNGHFATYKYHCSECGAYHRARYDYCPTCGARMDGDTDG